MGSFGHVCCLSENARRAKRKIKIFIDNIFFINYTNTLKQYILYFYSLSGNLEYLSSNLSGRSFNPISLLFDQLEHPAADAQQHLADGGLLWQRRHEPAHAHQSQPIR